jgi:hypothetical protein
MRIPNLLFEHAASKEECQCDEDDDRDSLQSAEEINVLRSVSGEIMVGAEPEP